MATHKCKVPEIGSIKDPEYDSRDEIPILFLIKREIYIQ